MRFRWLPGYAERSEMTPTMEGCDGDRGSVTSRVIRPHLAQPPGGKDAARGEWLLWDSSFRFVFIWLTMIRQSCHFSTCHYWCSSRVGLNCPEPDCPDFVSRNCVR